MAEKITSYKIIDIDGVLFLMNQAGVLKLFPTSGNGTPPGNGNGGSLPTPDFKPVELTWKQKGTSDHPRIEDGVLAASAFVLGHFCHLEVHLLIGGNTFLGGDVDNRFWYFVVPEILAPDFLDTKGIECAGHSLHIYPNQNNKQYDGSCYWTTNVGSGIDGIRLSLDDTDQRYHVGPSTIVWDAGSHFRFSISYRRASSEVF